MANDSLGSIITQGNFLRIDRALVEEVSSSGRNTGFIIISYSVPWQSGITTIQQLRLNINQNTAVMNSLGMPIRLSDIRRGMRVDATFSPNMTRSIPHSLPHLQSSQDSLQTFCQHHNPASRLDRLQQ